MIENIVLIGFMGVGKGRVGRALASITSLYAVDCDDLIESAMNMKVKKIFSQYGEEQFRLLERKTAAWLEENVTGTVISTGGGFVTVENISKIGKIIYLYDDFDRIIERISKHSNAVKKIKKRPLLKDMSAARQLFSAREPLYRKTADFTVNVHGRSELHLAQEIAQLCSLPVTAESL